MKKRILALLLALAMVFALASCGDETPGSSTSSGSTSSVSGETKAPTYATDEEALAAAQACYDELSALSGDALLSAFQEKQAALNYDGNKDEYFVSPDDTLVDGFSDAVLSVKENEIALSGKTKYGYFVVMHLPISDEKMEEIRDDYINTLFSDKLNAAAEAAEVQEAGALASLDYAAYFEKLDALQETINSKYSELAEAYTAEHTGLEASDTEVAQAVEADLIASLDPALQEDCISYLTDGALTADTVGLTVDGREVPVSVYLYFLGYYSTSYRNMYAYAYGGTELDLSSEYSEGVTWQQFFTTLAKNYAVQYATAMNQATANSVEPTEADRQTMEETLSTALESNMLYLGCNFSAMRAVLEYGLYGDAYQDSLYGENGSSPITLEDAADYADENGYYNCRYILFWVESASSDSSSN